MMKRFRAYYVAGERPSSSCLATAHASALHASRPDPYRHGAVTSPPHRGCDLQRHVRLRLQMVRICAPRLTKILGRERALRGRHHFFRRPLRSIHFTNGLLRENRREIEFAMRGQMSRCRKPKAVSVTKRFLEAECDRLR